MLLLIELRRGIEQFTVTRMGDKERHQLSDRLTPAQKKGAIAEVLTVRQLQSHENTTLLYCLL
jgi:hypothetical protein